MRYELTEEEYAAFEGLEASYEKMDKDLQAIAPTCHFTKMDYEMGEVEDGNWWECVHCGHTKDAG